ncbi:hypothetical protein MKZ38_003337 [Zalerion maritima]|uniref:Major facilitator superfamily (MFS) profile domain-containing protein n=1 Tax=Zalerion maritima TaxID=339359 RepID=A0AAD5WRV1_9PEZI|nr:hypothetical protein MKZ38_003337 [Zalerion maritima]
MNRSKSHGYEEPDEPVHHGRHSVGEIVYHMDQVDAEDANSSGDFDAPSDDQRTICISWEKNDPGNPYNWPAPKKALVFVVGVALVLNSTMGSSLPGNSVTYIMDEFHVHGDTNGTRKVLPISMFLLGYVFGPIVWGPMSESFGRKWISVVTFFFYSLATLACALASSWSQMLGFRLAAGIFASSPIAIALGILSDICGTARSRGRAMGAFMVSTTFGPLLSPIVSGFVSPNFGWRWTWRIALIVCAVTQVMVIFLPETYHPVLLAQRARRMNKEHPTKTFRAPPVSHHKSAMEFMTTVLTRPLRMLFFEPLVSSTCLYIGLVYAVFYMAFSIFPLIFQEGYGLSPGVTGLAFLPIGGGAALALPLWWGWDGILPYLRAKHAEKVAAASDLNNTITTSESATPETTADLERSSQQQQHQSTSESWLFKEEALRLPASCIGGPLFSISLFWLAASAPSDSGAPYWVSILAGVPFGLGYMLVFMSLLNYLTDAYKKYAASANAAASTSRSVFGCVLPLATGRMFESLGVRGALCLLGGLSLVLAAVPWGFLMLGERLRESSVFARMLREEEAREEEEMEGRDRGRE